eukprot:g5593.t1
MEALHGHGQHEMITNQQGGNINALVGALTASTMPAPQMPTSKKGKGGRYERQAFLREVQQVISLSSRPMGSYMPAPVLAAVAASGDKEFLRARKARAAKAAKERFKVGDEAYVQHAPRDDAVNATKKILFPYEPGTVVRVVPNKMQHGVRPHITRRTVGRHTCGLRARPSRPGLVAKLGPSPFTRGVSQSERAESYP